MKMNKFEDHTYLPTAAGMIIDRILWESNRLRHRFRALLCSVSFLPRTAPPPLSDEGGKEYMIGLVVCYCYVLLAS